ncbi:MAG: hypothetical protein KAI96_08365 [Thermodesulfovibrionia bacterium]|nr:hypothetical protein [Thermodesulfovibrionia bacterium]MCK5512811.1 hypothetical protein [Thermodesulfovibrionia bacterium]
MCPKEIKARCSFAGQKDVCFLCEDMLEHIDRRFLEIPIKSERRHMDRRTFIVPIVFERRIDFTL